MKKKLNANETKKKSRSIWRYSRRSRDRANTHGRNETKDIKTYPLFYRRNCVFVFDMPNACSRGQNYYLCCACVRAVATRIFIQKFARCALFRLVTFMNEGSYSFDVYVCVVVTHRVQSAQLNFNVNDTARRRRRHTRNPARQPDILLYILRCRFGVCVCV